MNGYDPTNMFLAPEKPYLIHYEIFINGNAQCFWSWFSAEEELMYFIRSYKKEYGMNFKVDDICEIGSVREIDDYES